MTPDWHKDVEIPTVDLSAAKGREAADVLKNFVGLFSISQFSVENTWLGASEIVLQFNFSINTSFSLIKYTLQQTDTFCPCVRYRVGSEVTRYKLWRHVGEVLYAPLYTNERIKPNFSIEIWNTPLSPAINAAVGELLSGKILKPTVKCGGANQTLAVATVCDSLKANLPFDGTSETLNVGVCSAHLTN